MPDLNELLAQAQKLQQQAQAAQAEAASLELEGVSGGGAVRVVVNGQGEPVRIQLSPEVVDPDDVELLEDLVLAAMRDALTKAKDVQEEVMGQLLPDLGGMGMGLGFELPGQAG